MRFALQRDVALIYSWLPLATGVVAVFLSLAPLHVPGPVVATPAFALMAVYYWTLHRPDLFPASGAFALGLLLDLLDGTPYLGLSSLVFLAVRAALLPVGSRIAGQSFPIVWAFFLVAAALALAFEWLMLGLLTLAPVGPRPVIFQALVTVALFPLAFYLLARLQRAVLVRP